MSYEAVQIR